MNDLDEEHRLDPVSETAKTQLPRSRHCVRPLCMLLLTRQLLPEERLDSNQSHRPLRISASTIRLPS